MILVTFDFFTMKILKIFEHNINERNIQMAVEAMRDGGIVIYPTDTLYAIGCDALNNNAINRICRIKGINPEKQWLSIVCNSISMAADYARFDNAQFKMLKRNTPGPFTFIFPSSSSLPKVFKGRKTVGVRIPDCKVALELARLLGNPIMTTTIAFDADDIDYATNPELIAENYCDNVEYVIDAGIGDVIPSTVIDCTDGNPQIIREGKGVLIEE